MAIGAAGSAGAAAGAPVVKTTQGRISGAFVEGVAGYLGVPYGAPPLGALRFMPPRPGASWSDVRDGSRYGYRPIQTYNSGFTPEGMNRPLPATERPPPFTRVPTNPADNIPVPQSEDCLYLDVWTKAAGTDARKPVMVWFHGGGFAFGAGSDPIYTGVNFVNRGDVVLVNVTHRLNVFGYLHLGDIAGEAYSSSGNVGMQDLVLALQWVRDNIAGFGGDPGNVTIFGESGGGAKTTYLMGMPSAKGLFHKAIVMSGSANRGIERADGTAFARELLAELKLSDAQVGELQKLDARKLFDASQAVAARQRTGILGGGARSFPTPIVDGVVLPHHPFDPVASELAADVVLMVGTTEDEAALSMRMNPKLLEMTEPEMRAGVERLVGPRTDEVIALYRKLHPDHSPARLLASIQTGAGARASAYTMADRKTAQRAAVYYYIFSWNAPGGEAYGANHGLDVGVTFANSSGGWSGTGPKVRAIEDVMLGTWTSFARNGRPDNGTIPTWPAYTTAVRPIMLLNTPSKVVNDYEGEARTFWMNMPPAGQWVGVAPTPKPSAR